MFGPRAESIPLHLGEAREITVQGYSGEALELIVLKAVAAARMILSSGLKVMDNNPESLQNDFHVHLNDKDRGEPNILLRKLSVVSFQ